jgi:type II secretion system protein H
MESTAPKPTWSPYVRCPAGSRHSGFTLIEVLVVVALVAMMAGLGGGVYVGTYKRMLVEKAARQFLLTARYGRILAIERQRPYEIELDESNKGFHLKTVGFNEQTGQSEETIVRDYYCKPVLFEGDVAFEDVKVVSLTGDSEDGDEQQGIWFYPNGSAEPAVVQIGDGRSSYSVAIVASTGMATMYKGQAEELKTGIIDLDAQ